MAKDKKSFVLYADLIGRVEHLTNEEKGVLFQHLLEYVNDLNPVLEDRILIGVWKPIEQQLKRDLKKFELTKEERSKSGQLGNLKRYHLDLYKKVKSEDITLKEAQRIAKTRIAEQSDTNLAVNDNVNVNVNDIIIKEEKIFLEASKNYKNYAKQLYEDAVYIESLSRTQLKEPKQDVAKLTVHKYLKLFLSHLNEYRHIHNTKKEFSINFSNWLRKQKIEKVYPKAKKQRYF